MKLKLFVNYLTSAPKARLFGGDVKIGCLQIVKMKILVIIVTYNAMQWAERCFDSLRKSTIVPDVFVVDNGSTDETQTYIQHNYPEVKFIQSKENLGFGKANNMGMQYALDNEYDYVYLLNQDAWVMEDTFEKLIEISLRNQEYGVLSPFQMNADMEHIDQRFIRNVMNWKSNPDIANDLYNQQLKDVYPVHVIMAAHWFVTRACLLKIGGFSPSFPHYREDDNYAERMHYFGLKLGIVPSLRVVHDRGWREDPISKKLHMMYTGCIRVMSSPVMSKREAYLWIANNVIKSTAKYKSLLPFKYVWKLMCQKRTLEKNKKISMSQDCAFLNMRN